MNFYINDELWHVQYENPSSELLRRSDGVYTLGVTDRMANTIYLSNCLSDTMFDRVLSHELTHAVCMTYGISLPIETEERLCNFISDHAREIISLTDLIENILLARVVY